MECRHRAQPLLEYLVVWLALYGNASFRREKGDLNSTVFKTGTMVSRWSVRSTSRSTRSLHIWWTYDETLVPVSWKPVPVCTPVESGDIIGDIIGYDVLPQVRTGTTLKNRRPRPRSHLNWNHFDHTHGNNIISPSTFSHDAKKRGVLVPVVTYRNIAAFFVLRHAAHLGFVIKIVSSLHHNRFSTLNQIWSLHRIDGPM